MTALIIFIAAIRAVNALARAFTSPMKRLMYGGYRPVLERVEIILILCALAAWLSRP
jgi:hypothetical protein